MASVFSGKRPKTIDDTALGILGDTYRTLGVVKIPQAQFGGEPLAKPPEGGQQEPKIFRIVPDQQTHILGRANVAVKCHGDSAHDDKFDPAFSQPNNFCKREFYRS